MTELEYTPPLFERIAALEAEVERLRGACRSAIEAIRAGAEPWMLCELEVQILTALEPAPVAEREKGKRNG